VVPSDDAAALAAAWSRLLAMPSPERDELGRRARERVLANYEIEQTTERIWELYRSLAPA